MRALPMINFRDLAGLSFAGGQLAEGRLYRSEGPAGFTPMQQAELGELGIRLVCDLRTPRERMGERAIWDDDTRILHFDVNDQLHNFVQGSSLDLEAGLDAAQARHAMIRNYASIPAALHKNIGLLIEELIQGRVPLLIHCAAGKDRTGVLIAILLSWLDVPRLDIERDYLVSNIYARNHPVDDLLIEGFAKLYGFRPSPSWMAAVMGVDRDFLDAALTAIEETWGDIHQYFAMAGVTQDQRRIVQKVLCKDAA